MAYGFNGVGRMVDILGAVNENSFRQAYNHTLIISESLSYKDNAFKNKILYRGDAYELEQLYAKLRARGRQYNFWGQFGDTKNQTVLKVHSGLPALMTDTMAGVCLSDMRSITFENVLSNQVWEQIEKENDMKGLYKKGLVGGLVVGDGALKWTYDFAITDYPIPEYYDGDEVDYVWERGRIKEIVFFTKYYHKEQEYTLKEIYGYGYIKNELYHNKDLISLDSIPQTANLRDCYFAGCEAGKDGSIKKRGAYMLAVPLIFFPSSKWEGRGESIFDKREGILSAIDEGLSQWVYAERMARPKTFIKDSLIKRDPKTNGEMMKPNAFNDFFVVDDDMGENGKNGITTVQFEIPWQSYFQTHVAFLDCALQGFMSAATLGIDVKKMDNAEAQREKEKTTLYTRSSIVDIYGDALKKFAMAGVQSYFDLHGTRQEAGEPNVNFGDYANPSFEAQIETISKARVSGIMSIEAAVEELYGDTKTDEWKAEEIQRLKDESGCVSLDEPGFGDNSEFNFMTGNGGELDEEDEDDDDEGKEGKKAGE